MTTFRFSRKLPLKAGLGHQKNTGESRSSLTNWGYGIKYELANYQRDDLRGPRCTLNLRIFGTSGSPALIDLLAHTLVIADFLPNMQSEIGMVLA